MEYSGAVICLGSKLMVQKLRCSLTVNGEPADALVASYKTLLERNPNPTQQEIKEATAGNLCRCTGYNQIVEAIEQAAEVLRKEAA